MKPFLLFLLVCLFPVSHLTAQGYRVLGYAGKDTVLLGTATVNAAGRLILKTGDYRGAIVLQPDNAGYAQLAGNLEKIKNIKSEGEFNAAKRYISETLDFASLYSSGWWQDYIQYWVAFYLQTAKSQEEFAQAFVPVARQALSRTVRTSPQTASLLAKDLLVFFEQYNLEKAAQEIAAFSVDMTRETGEHNEIANRLLTAMRLIGKPAPAIQSPLGKIEPKQAVVLFHEISCGNCAEQIAELKAHYQKLRKAGYEVISVAGEAQPDAYVAASNTYPWPDKIWEKEGLKSETFQTYGVASTPTLFVVDKNGAVVGRYARLAETGLLK